jgi:hypothetical protein
MCQPTYRLSNAIAPGGPCTGACADCPSLNGGTKRPELFRPRAVAHVRGIPPAPVSRIWSSAPLRRCGPPRPGRPGAASLPRPGPRPVPGPGLSPLNCDDSLVAARRRPGCGQVTCGADQTARRGRAGRGGPPGPRPPPAARPPAIPRSWKAGRSSPDSGLPRDFRDAIARILRTRACKGLQRFTNAELRRRGIQPARYPDENSATRDPGPSPGITGTPRPPRTGRVPPPGRAARGRSARCRPARAGRPAPRPRRAPGTAGHPGRTGP